MGLFDVLPGVTGRDEETGSPPDASTGDGGEGERAVDRDPGELSPADFRERAETLAGRSDVPELDFTEAALADLDSMATGTHPVDDELSYGSYLGETLVRAYDGEWVREDGWRVAVALGDDSPGNETATRGPDADEATADSSADVDEPAAGTVPGPETAEAAAISLKNA